MISLRPYQADAIQACRDRLASGRIAPLVVAPTGAGKTIIEGALVQLHLAKAEANRVLIVAHRRELIGQIARTLLRMGITDIGEIIPGVTQRPRARVQVASTQTLRARNHAPPATMVIYDECVTGDTMIGGARADYVKVGDFVPSWNDERKSVVWRKVTRVFVNQATSLLVLRVAGRALTCTSAHPIWTGRGGYIYAKDVVVGDVCRVRGTVTERRSWTSTKDVWQTVREHSDDIESRAAIIRSTWDTTTMHGVHRTYDDMVERSMAIDVQPRVLEQDTRSNDGRNQSSLDVSKNDDTQPDARSSVSSEGGCNPSQDRTPSTMVGRQGSRHDRASAHASSGTGIGLDCRAPDGGEGSLARSAEVHLPGPSSSQSEASDRGGRREPRHVEGEGFRSSKNDVPRFARVDSIEVLEPGGDGHFGGRAPNGTVYNFEVEGEHNFFANGILTHNCHHYSSDDWSELAGSGPYAKTLRVGFTATPMRSDGRGMAPAFDSLVVVSTIKELTALGHLVPCRVIAPRPLSRGNLSHSPADAYLAHANGMRTVVFADFVINAEKFVAEFREKGIDAVIIHGLLSDHERKRALLAHQNGAVLVNCMVLTEGWDSPETSCCILARGCGSVGTYLQIVGRVLRPAPGKSEALLIDLTGRSFDAHGPPDADRMYSLTGKGIRRKDDSEEFAKPCPICGQPIEVGEPCAICGHLEAGSSTIEEPRYTGDELAERYAGKRSEDDEKRIDTLARWYAEAKARGNRPWAALAKYTAVYGSEPSPSIRSAAEQLSRTLACVTCVECKKVTARTYAGGKCGRCAFGKKKAG